MKVVVGTRGSALAQWQTNHIIAALKRVAPNLEIEIKIIKTTGDKDQTTPLEKLGGRGVFTTELEQALLSREIDLAVHSLKDLPTDETPNLTLTAISAREDPRDCIVSRDGLGLMQLPRGARVGTSSARRSAQVLALRPDVQIIPLRGNVDTRLHKARTDEFDAIMLAAAGVIRLGRAAEITEYLSLNSFLPDPGQGALAVQIRADDTALRELVAQIDDASTRAATTAERAFLAGLGGGCRMPIAAFAEIRDGVLHLRGLVGTSDGRKIIRGEQRGAPRESEKIGRELAQELLQRGAAEILDGVGAHGHAPLRGKRIVITRAQEKADEFARELQSLGAEAIHVPTISIAPLEDFRELDAALEKIAERTFDWIVFTSANGVRAVMERMRELQRDAQELAAPKIAAIGPATAEALTAEGLRADFVPSEYLSETVGRELPIQRGESALLLRADIASDMLRQELAARGVNVHNVIAYRTIPARDGRERAALRQTLARGVDAITFTSSSTVQNFVALLDGDKQGLNNVAVACIGPVTAATVSALGLRVDIIAREHTVEGLIAALQEYFEIA